MKSAGVRKRSSKPVASTAPEESVRLNKFIANSGVCARREADDLIKQGRFEYVNAPTGGLDGARFYEQAPPAPPPPEPPKRELGPIDRWRYDSCRTEASKAPTKEGVRAGLQVCNEKFGQ